MPLEFRKQRDGRLRDVWFGRFEINGERFCYNLGIKISGIPPKSLSLMDDGDLVFERSRASAQAKLDAIVEEARTKQGSARLVEKLYEIKTGEIIRSVLLSNLPEEWGKIARKRKPDDRYASQCKSTLKRFAEFVHQENIKAVEIAHVTRTAARSFMDAESNRGMTAKTWNDTLKLLRATFKYLLPAGAINPFSDLPTRETDTVFRKPYSPEELAAIVDAARTDEFIRPILVTGICTAMRRGDCCLLQWNDVDLQRRFITVKTAKTGQTVSIPIFPMLYDELKLAAKNQKLNDGFVFPEQARMYQENPDGITWRVKKMLAAAGFRDDEESLQTANKNNEQKKAGASPLPSPKRDEAHILRGEIHVTRKNGLRRASVRDFHSFRVTWVTLALTAGVPLELVQKVTGHKTTDIVLKHYFQPGQEAFRQALQSAMPKLLTNGQKSPKDEMREILSRMTVKTLKKDKARIEELVAGL
jgi:integrase